MDTVAAIEYLRKDSLFDARHRCSFRVVCRYLRQSDCYFNMKIYCEILIGFMVPTDKKGYVRSFATNDQELNELIPRSNDRYDLLIDVFEVQKQLNSLWVRDRYSRKPPTDKLNEKGLMGVCLLRELAHFDVGRSFMADSLHNVYIGAFVSHDSFSFPYVLSN